MEHRVKEIQRELHKALNFVSAGPWVRSGVRSAYPAHAKATWIGPDGQHIIGVMFSDRTHEEYRASVADAAWVWLTQPENIKMLLDEIDRLEALL